jgi:hypothetical protein
MAITQDRADDSPRKDPAPRQTASIVSCKISSASTAFTGHQQNLREHDPAVLAVERGHRVLVAPADPAQQRNVVAGTVVTGSEGRGAGFPVRIVHL